MTTAIETVSAFFAEWSKSPEATLKSYRDYFTPETVWENVGLATTTGIDEALAFMESLSALGAETIKVDMVHIVAAGDVVLTERVDRFIAADGSETLAIRLMGVFELQNGKVIRWRDYFDTAALPTPAS